MIIDRPVPASIFFELLDEKSPGEDFIYLPIEMFSRGLILERPRELRRSMMRPRFIELICTFTDGHAMNNWLRDPAVFSYYDMNLKQLLRAKPLVARRRDLVYDFDEARVCACEKSSVLLLSGQPPLLEYKGFLTCGECLRGISAYKLPEQVDLVSWSLNFRDVNKVWLRPGPLSDWARDQSTRREGSWLESWPRFTGSPSTSTCSSRTPAERPGAPTAI